MSHQEPTNQEKSYVYEDTNLVAYLMYRGCQVIPFRKEGEANRVAFDVSGDSSQALNEYHANSPVGIQDYVKCLKTVRSMMFTLKGMG